MPRIPEEAIERVKEETDLAAVVRSRGIELHRHGSKDFAGLCPFHPDKTPSFIVSPEKGLFHCMGCGSAGNAIQFVEKFDGVSFRHAYELLAEGRPVFVAPGRRAAGGPPGPDPTGPGPAPGLPCPLDPAADDAALFGQVVAYYHDRLKKTPAALEYLRGRGLLGQACLADAGEEALDRFQLGFADRTLGLRLPEAYGKEGAAIRERLQKLGLYRPSGHEHFTGCVVMPIFSDAGRCVGMYGRKITPGLRKGTPMHLYLPGPHAGIWNVTALAEPELILCEAPLDALTFWVNGIRNVTFIYGTQGFTDELFDALLRRGLKRVRIAYDADEAGNKAAARDAVRLTAQGIECLRVRFPWGMDANDYARKIQPAAKALEIAVRAAEPLVAPKPGEGGMGGGKPAIRGQTSEVRRQEPAGSKVSEGSEAPAPPGGTPGQPAAGKALSYICNNAPFSSSLAAISLAADEKRPPSPDPGRTAQPEAETPTLERLGDPAGGGTGYLVLKLGPREYRVGGLEKNNSLEVMKIALRLRHGERFHLDTLDLLRDNERRRFVERAAEETGLEKDLLKGELGKLLLALEREQEERLARAVEPAGAKRPTLTPEEKAEALELLESPDLVQRIGEAFESCGLVGEESNRLAAYLACTSRKLDKPLAVIIQSTTAAGKSTLMEAVLSMFPEEERVKYSAMTGQSLYYLGETDLQHKILAIVEEEGAEKASYALKLLQSEGELTIASTGKDPNTGRMVTHEYRVQGPVTIFLTTTAVEIDEELQNRCLMLTVDESREQTERIHALQRQARTLAGLRLKKRRARLLTLLRNAQRLLQPADILNPWADALTFTAERTRTRRDHEKYLALMDAIALLHQYQRPRQADTHEGERTEYIRVTLEDIELANRLAPELLGRSLDELPPQTRRVYQAIKALVCERCEAESVQQRFALFSRREVQRRLGWSLTQIRFHLERLRELEYIAARAGRLGSPFQYELLTDCREPEEYAHIGLLDVAKLRTGQPETGVRRVTCRENRAPVGGCRVATRQVQVVEEPAVAVNLSA
jgi:DNA primase